jgi:isopenicillin-N epimerase
MANPHKAHFLLDPSVTYLNFGSFGACVKPVFEQYRKFQLELETEPAQFFFKLGPAYLKQSREALGQYINCDGDDLVYTPNPSYGVNIVAKSFPLERGDEVLTTDLEYGACERTWNYYCRKAGAVLKRMPLPFPLQSPAQITEALMSGVTERTKLVFVSHLTSTTALVLPVKEIADRCRKLGIPVFIDGAHAAGHITCDLKDLDPDMYTGACHKWMLTPKGSAFLYVKKQWQNKMDPLVVSWGYESASPSHSQFLDYHEGQGTRDYSAFLTIPAAIGFMEEHDWRSVSKACKKLVRDNAQKIADALGATLLFPATEEFIGQMLSVPVNTPAPERLQKELFDKYRIELPVMRHGIRVLLRYSVNAFNDQSDLDRLYDALLEIRKKTDLLPG